MQHGLLWDIERILVNGSPRQSRQTTRYAIRASSTND
jgi:hypothetical protein